jgi:hypothetical protein
MLLLYKVISDPTRGTKSTSLAQRPERESFFFTSIDASIDS